MDLIILLIKLLIRGLESTPGRSTVRSAPPPIANQPPPAQMVGAVAPARRPAPKLMRKPVKATKPAAIAARAAAQPTRAPENAMPPSRTAAPATLIAEALRVPKNFAAALAMTELLRPPASLRSYRTSLD
jgi:hypothetical protein